MQIPEHWAEARVEDKVNGKRRVIRRFGWSDTSAEEAQRNAEERAHAAMAELQAGRQVAQRERKLPYGGFGLPIREQILAKRGDVVITRNSYGAHCLNVPDVLFADVDAAPPPSWWSWLIIICVLGSGVVTTFLVGEYVSRGWLLCFAWPLGFLVAFTPAVLIMLRLGRKRRERLRSEGLGRLRAAALSMPATRFAVYETPLGWRLLALHRTFDPAAAESRDLMQALSSDVAYVQMCELQACFRARVSGKPWRMNVRHIRPRPGVWPVHPDRRDLRDTWVAEYEAAAVNFAACRFVEEIGSGPVHPRCAEVQRIHDELSRARSGLPIA